MEQKGTYKFTMEATRDLHRIWRYSVRHWSMEQADLYFIELIGAAHLVADNPELGLDRSDIGPCIRGIKKTDIFFSIWSSPTELSLPVYFMRGWILKVGSVNLFNII